MSRHQDRDRERDRDHRESRRAPAPAAPRKNEYFLPKDGIDREVITADICRYLGNDALVRPYNYENPQTRMVQEGYLINAYRNLTSPMIADLKADSARWEAERRNATRGQNTYAEYPTYRTSQTHHSRQVYGPTESSTPGGTQGYAQPSASSGNVYDDVGTQYQSTQYTQPAGQGYMQTPADYPQQQDNSAYVYGGAFRPEGSSGRSGRAPVAPTTPGTIPRGDQYASSTSAYAQPVDPRFAGYTQPPVSTPYAQQQPGQPSIDPGFGRGPSYDTPEYNQQYDYGDSGRVYQENAYTQSVGAPSTTVTAEPQRRPRDREERNSKHHRSDNRR